MRRFAPLNHVHALLGAARYGHPARPQKAELRFELRELSGCCKDFIVCNYEACSDNGARLQPNIVRLSPIPVSSRHSTSSPPETYSPLSFIFERDLWRSVSLDSQSLISSLRVGSLATPEGEATLRRRLRRKYKKPLNQTIQRLFFISCKKN